MRYLGLAFARSGKLSGAAEVHQAHSTCSHCPGSSSSSFKRSRQLGFNKASREEPIGRSGHCSIHRGLLQTFSKIIVKTETRSV
jgi:hypothetical protein